MGGLTKIIICTLLIGTFSCAKMETVRITKNIRIVHYAYNSGEKKSYIQKYNKNLSQWFNAGCPGTFVLTKANVSSCIHDLKYTKRSMTQINFLTSEEHKGGNSDQENNISSIIEVSNSNNAEENSNPPEPEIPEIPELEILELEN